MMPRQLLPLQMRREIASAMSSSHIHASPRQVKRNQQLLSSARLSPYKPTSKKLHQKPSVCKKN